MKQNILRRLLPALAIAMLLSACGGTGNVPPTGSTDKIPQESQQQQPSQEPTQQPTLESTQSPSQQPAQDAAQQPGQEPTQAPEPQPSQGPAQQPSQGPTQQPAQGPAQQPPQETQQPQPSPTGTGDSATDGKILIAYFTRANNVDTLEGVDAVTSASINLRNGEYVGNTELLALWIQEKAGGDLFSIEVAEPYSSDYDETDAQANREQQENAHPALAAQVDNLEDYSIVFLGFPNWYYDMPMAVYSFLEGHDLAGKTIIPFCTSGGGRFSNSLSTIAALQPDAEVVQDGLALMHNSSLLNSQDDVNEWLAGLDGPWND